MMHKMHDERIKILMGNCETFQKEIDLLENLVRWFARIWMFNQTYYQTDTMTKMRIDIISKQPHDEESAQETLMLMTKPTRGPSPMDSIYEYCCMDMRIALKGNTFQTIMMSEESYIRVNHQRMKFCPFCGEEIEINRMDA